MDLLRMSSGLASSANRTPATRTRAIPITCSSTRGRSTRSPTRSTGRCSSRRTRTAATGTAIRSPSATWSSSPSRKRGEKFLTWPQRALFDRIGIRRQVLETDPYGNFLISGYDYGTARNWARLGLLYLQDGVWQGERILPEGWTVREHAGAGVEAACYGGFFWMNRVNNWNLPPDTYFAAGAGGQNTWIVPSHDLVIVRMGHMRGQGPARRATNTALGLVMEAVGRVTSG